MYLVHCLDQEAELAAAEAWAFTGQEMRERVVHAPVAVDIAHAAYVRYCVAVEAGGATFPDLLEDCRRSGMAYERFHLDLLRPPPKLKLDSPQVILAVANAITGRPDLTRPLVRLAVVASTEGWVCGRIMSVGRNRWLEGMHRPHHFSSALPQRMSRALANMVASPGETLIDPCCGIGTVVMEALEAGIVAFGADQSGRMLHFLGQNLDHFGLPRRLFRADARQLAGHFDGAVIDLPYGRNSTGDAALWRELIAPLASVVTRAAIVAPCPIADLIGEAGLRLRRVAAVPKGGLVRHVHLVVPDASAKGMSS